MSCIISAPSPWTRRHPPARHPPLLLSQARVSPRPAPTPVPPSPLGGYGRDGTVTGPLVSTVVPQPLTLLGLVIPGHGMMTALTHGPDMPRKLMLVGNYELYNMHYIAWFLSFKMRSGCSYSFISYNKKYHHFPSRARGLTLMIGPSLPASSIWVYYEA